MLIRSLTVPGVALAIALTVTASRADFLNPFASFGGSWSGSGAIVMANGAKERIRCRAEYQAAERVNVAGLQLELRCASDSYNFELQSNLSYASGAISGMWSEQTRRLFGNISGKFSDNQIHALIESPTFQAILNLAMRGDRQTVTIEAPGSEISHVAIALARVSR